MWTYILITLGVVLLLGAGISIGLVTARRRRELSGAPERRTLPEQPTPAGATRLDERDSREVDDTGAGAGDSAVATAGLDDLLAPPEEALGLERPERVGDRWQRLRGRLARSQGAFGKGLLGLLSRDRLDEETWEDLEDTLITADVGVGPSAAIVENLRVRARVEGFGGADDARAALREELVSALDSAGDRSLATARHDGVPAVVLVVGVNGTGKTTTCGKLARVLVADDRDVVLAAADTFRAAAVEQLSTWGDRVGVPVVRGPEGGDPASVAFEAVRAGIEGESDVVIVDTAGRLHTKTGLMDELGKIKRVVEKQAPLSEVLLVLDATTGQNGLVQARVFAEAVEVTGVALTKLDGTAKGGIVFAVQAELGLPVKVVGLGEGADDLAPFVAEEFVDALLS